MTFLLGTISGNDASDTISPVGNSCYNRVICRVVKQAALRGDELLVMRGI